MLKGPALKALDAALELIEFSCRTVLAGFVDEEEDAACPSVHPLESVCVRADLSCSHPMEVPYFSSGAFPSICAHSATAEDLQVGAEGFYPMCISCNKPKLAKRKRKLFTEQQSLSLFI